MHAEGKRTRHARPYGGGTIEPRRESEPGFGRAFQNFEALLSQRLAVIFMGEYQGVWQGRSSIRLPQQWGMISPGWRQRT